MSIARRQQRPELTRLDSSSPGFGLRPPLLLLPRGILRHLLQLSLLLLFPLRKLPRFMLDVVRLDPRAILAILVAAPRGGGIGGRATARTCGLERHVEWCLQCPKGKGIRNVPSYIRQSLVDASDQAVFFHPTEGTLFSRRSGRFRWIVPGERLMEGGQ